MIVADELFFVDDLDVVEVEAAEVVDDEWGRGKGQCARPYGCGAVWFGFRIEHCAVCHQTFSGETTGKAHRVGRFEPNERRCLIPDELRGLGLWVEPNADGTPIWHGSPNKHGIQKRHPRHKGKDT